MMGVELAFPLHVRVCVCMCVCKCLSATHGAQAWEFYRLWCLIICVSQTLC